MILCNDVTSLKHMRTGGVFAGVTTVTLAAEGDNHDRMRQGRGNTSRTYTNTQQRRGACEMKEEMK